MNVVPLNKKRKVSSLADLASVNAYLRRIGAEPRSLRTAVVKVTSGSYWRDIAVIRFDTEGVVTAKKSMAPNAFEQVAIADEFAVVQWPDSQPIENLVGHDLPDALRYADPNDVYEFRGLDGRIVMVQLRVETEQGKNYFPWSFWSDGTWRQMEPDGALPLWGLDRLGDHTTVIIHEGAKAARSVADMVAGRSPDDRDRLALHPWGRELSGAAHLGWIGGAMSPGRTDWSVLRRHGVTRAYIVSDNDGPGRAAVPEISEALNIVTNHVQFTDEWPLSFDLGDPFPDSMFAELDGRRIYVGPAFHECLHPATWATDLVAVPRGKPTAVLREHFKALWAYAEESNVFVNRDMPQIAYKAAILDNHLAAFSHRRETSVLMVAAFQGRTARLTYRPDVAGQTVTSGGSTAINLHLPSGICARPGNLTPWTDYLHYMVPGAGDRREFERWLATLIARPEIRMGYGLLLISEQQGIGKTTLGSVVLKPLLGHSNVSWPSEKDITGSAFNGWLANRRLVFVNEIYSGHSWKAYHDLKSVITDQEVTVNEKNEKPYTTSNWAHVIACSNSERALKMEQDDRRWFYPKLTEVRRSDKEHTEFRRWVGSGGLAIIQHWAENYGDYVSPSERAPLTESKKAMIRGSLDEGEDAAAELAEAMLDLKNPCAITTKDLVQLGRSATQGRMYSSDLCLRKAMQGIGCFTHPDRIKINKVNQYVVLNPAGKAQVETMAGQPAEDINTAIRAMITRIDQIIERPF